MMKQLFLTALLVLTGASGRVHASSPVESQSPEDLILSDALAPAWEGPRHHPYVNTGFLVGDDGFWSAELEAGMDFAGGWQASVLGARSQVGAAATNEAWVNASYLLSSQTLVGVSGVYGDGPSPQKYFGGLVNATTHVGDWRVKLQSGSVAFRGTVATLQVPVRGELGYIVSRDVVLAIGGAYYVYTVKRSQLATVLGATTLQAGSGILSGFPLDQVYAKVEAALSETVHGSLALSSAATAYQSERVLGLNAKAHYALAREYAVGAELSLSRGAGNDFNYALGPTFRCYW